MHGKIKKALAADGWRLVVDQGPDVSVGRGGTTRTFNTFNTRYRLAMSAEQYDWQFPDLDPMYVHEISVIDNRSGTEVLMLSGSHAGKTITKKFMQALRN